MVGCAGAGPGDPIPESGSRQPNPIPTQPPAACSPSQAARGQPPEEILPILGVGGVEPLSEAGEASLDALPALLELGRELRVERNSFEQLTSQHRSRQRPLDELEGSDFVLGSATLEQQSNRRPVDRAADSTVELCGQSSQGSVPS